MKSWYSIKNKAGNVLDISLHDEIGLWGVTAADFMAELSANQDVRSINLSIHSPGGNLLDGLAIYNKLKAHPARVFGKVEGLAASAASLVLMASDHIEMPENSFLMIHNAHGVAGGDPDDLREFADLMERMQNSAVNVYHARTGKDPGELASMMKAETWMTAEDALADGFIDTITERIEVAAKIAAFSRYFKDVPVKNAANVEAVNNERDLEKFLREAGLSKGLATALVSRVKTVFKGDPDNRQTELEQLSERLARFKA